MLRMKMIPAVVMLALMAPVAMAHAAADATSTAKASATDSAPSSNDATGESSKDRASKAKEGNSKTLEAVVVTGQPVSFTNNELPPVLTKLSAPLSSIVDAVNLLPGVNVTPGGVFGSDDWSVGITMRGFTQGQLGFTVDGLPNGATSYGGGAKPNRFLDSENMRTVSVSQGTADIASPSSQALGGTINYESIDPSMTRALAINYSTGSWNAEREFVRYDTGAIFNDDTYAYVSFSNTDNKRWIGSGSNGHTSRVHLDSKLISYLTDKLTMTARLSWDDTYENNYNSVTLAQFKQDPNWDRLNWNWTGKPYIDQNFVEPWNTVRQNALAGVRFDYTPSDTSSVEFYPYFQYMKGSGGWLPPYQLFGVDGAGALTNNRPAPGGAFSKVFFVDAGGQPLAVPAGCASPYDATCYAAGATPASSFRQSLYKNNRYGFITKGTWQVGMNNLEAGLWLENLDRINGRVWYAVTDPTVSWNYARPAYYKQFDQLLTTETRKFYAQDQVHLGPVDITAGVSKYLVSLSGKDQINSGTQFASLNSDSDLLPSLGAVYHLDHRSQVYASVTKNFSPVPDGVLQAAAIGTDISHVKPETSINIDAGYRYSSNDLSLGLSVYHVRFANQITFINPQSDGVTQINYTIGTAGTYVNVGGVQSKGVEAIANWKASPNMDLYASATFNNSTYLGNVNGIKAGNKVAGQPARMLALSANYHTADGFQTGISGKYVGGRYGTIDNTEKLPSYVSVDAYAGYHIGFADQARAIKSVDLMLNVTNLMDRRYLGTVDSAGTPGYYFIAPGRTAVFSIKANL